MELLQYQVFILLSLISFGLATGQAVYDCRRMNDCMNGGLCTLGQTTCVCQDGYTGYKCQVVTGGPACQSKVCNNGAICYSDNGVETCACAYGYYGDTCDSESVAVTCNGGSVEFSFTMPDAFTGTVQLSGTNIPPSCAFAETAANGMKTYSLTVDTSVDSTDTACGKDLITIVGDQATDANYTGRVEVLYLNTIVANTDELYKLTCSHMGEGVEISKEITNIGVNTEGNLTQVEKVKPYSPVDFEIVDMAGGALPAVMFVGDSYKICFFLTDTSVYTQVSITSCTTNNTVAPPNTKTYDIYSQGCPTRKGMMTTSIQEAATKTIEDVDFPSVCLPIKAFKFVDSDNLALSCKVKLCKDGNGDCAIPTTDACTTIMENAGSNPVLTTLAPDTNTTEGGAANETSTETASGDNGTSTNATTAANDTTTDEPIVRRRRAAEDQGITDEKTVTTYLTVYGERDFNSNANQGKTESSVEDCLSQTEIMAVVTVLASVVLILFIACFVLICILMKRKSKMTVYDPQTTFPKPERFRIPRAHVNQAYGEI